MTAKEFNEVVERQLEMCKDILCVKAEEYADKANDDRLHNFKCAGGLMNCDPKEALMGMMVKHTVSVADMCRSGKSYPMELWEEKITDSINYLLLLKGLVVEEELNSWGSNKNIRGEFRPEWGITSSNPDVYPSQTSQDYCSTRGRPEDGFVYTTAMNAKEEKK